MAVNNNTEDPKYRKKIYDFLSTNFADFKRTEADFYKKLDTDSNYAGQVYDVISKNYSDFGRPRNEFLDLMLPSKKKEPSEVGGEAGTSARPSDSGKGFGGLKPVAKQPTQVFKEQGVGEDTMLARKMERAQRPAISTTGVRLPAAPKVVAEEKAVERALAPKLPEAPKEDIGELEGLSNAIDRGILQGKLADMLALGQMPKREDIREIARINKELTQIPSTGAYQRFNTAPDLKTAAKEFIDNPFEITSQLISESLSALIRHGYSRAIAGAGTGAALGSLIPIPGISTAAGAGTGYIAGMGVAGYNLEMASSIMDSFREAGVDITDEKSLTKAFDDPNTLKKAREFANKRAVPIAIFDMFSAGMGGKLLGKPAKTILGKVGKGAAEVGIQMGMAGAGETAAQLTAGQKINPTAILAEVVGEAGGGAPDIIVGTMIENKKNNQSIRKEAVRLDIKPEELQDMLDISEASGEITDAQANEIKKEYEDIQKVKQAVPEEFKKNADVIEALEQKRQLEAKKQGLDPVFAKKIDEQIKALDTKIDDIVATGEVAPQVPAAEEKTYRVEYFDPESRKMTHQMFATEAEGEAFKKTLTREQTSQGVTSYFEKAPAKGVGEVAPEVAPEAKPQIYEFEGKRYEVTDRSVTEVETGNLLPVSKIDKIRKEGKLIEEVEEAPEVPAAPKVEAKKAEYKREDFPEEQMRVDTPITQKLVNYLADVLGVPRINIADGKYVSWVREQTFNFKDAFGGENLAGLEFALNAPRQVFDRITKFAESASLGVGEVAPEAAPEVPAAPVEALKDVESTAKALEGKSINENILKGTEVSDNNGKPIKVYHGTNVDFEDFKKTKSSRHILMSPHDVETEAFFFHPKKEFAKGFGDKVKEVFLNIKKLANNHQQDLIDAIKETWGKNGSVETANNGNIYFDDYPNDSWIKKMSDKDGIDWMLLENKDFINNLKKRGIDGTGVWEDDNSTSYAVFDSKNIIQDKSSRQISEAYHKAKADGSNPELVKAVEDLLVGEVAPEAAPEVPAAPAEEEVSDKKFWDEYGKSDYSYGQYGGKSSDTLYIKDTKSGKVVKEIKIKNEDFEGAKKEVFKWIDSKSGTKILEAYEEVYGEPELPAAPIEEELPFGEVAPREQKKQREITNRTKRALNIEITDNPIGEVLQYFLGGGKVNPDAMDELFGRKKQGYRWEGNESKVKQERKLRRQLLDKNAPSIEALAEKIAGTDRLDQTQDYRNAIEEVLLSHSRRETMADELVDSFDTEYAEKMRQEELEELGKAAEEEAKYITSLVPEAQREEIAKVLDRFRKANGRVDWSEMERELEGGFEPILLDLSEQSQKFINDAIEQIKSTGRISGVPIEALPAAEEKGRAEAPPPKIEAADKRAEARKELRDAFNDLMNLGVAYDPRSQAEKQVRLTKAIINVIKQESIGAIKDLKKYIKDNIGFDISDNDAKYLLIESKKPEYAIQEPAAGEVPVQPKARASEKVEAGVPPTRPPKAPEEGKVEGEEEVEYTPREKEKALLNKLYKAKNIPEDAKIGFEKEGLKYQTKSQKEAELIANGVIDEIGIDDALELADSLKFDGDVNSLIYAESLNRLSKMEREAKSPEEKRALAKKFAEVGIEYGIKSQYGGRFNAAISYFYQKSPLGIVLMEDMKRKQEFDKFAKNKEQYWKEAHDIIKAELDALKLELESKKADPSIKTSEAKIMAARLKRAALKEKYKKGKGGGLTLTTGGLTKEGIEYVGELVATYIEEGIANVEVIVQRIFLDLKDVTAKDLDEKTANQVEEEVRKKYKETKGKSTLNKIRKKLEKLSKKKQDEVIRKSFNQIIESGGLDYDDFRKIIAETTGYPELTDQEKVRLEELVTKTNAVERMAEKAREDRTEQSLKDFRRAEMEAGKAARELNQLVWNKPDILKRLTSIMQLSTLGIPALINNPIYNIWNQATLRFPVGLINDLVDRGMTLAAQATGTEYQREYNAIDTQKEFFKKLGFGAKESVEQMITGLSRQDYIQKEVGGQQIQPLQAAKDWWASFTGKKRLTSAQMLDKFIQATAGVPAEAIARTLNIGDKPQRFAAEGAQASAFAKSFGLKDLDYKLFIEFPREEAFRIYKSKGLSDAEAAQKAEYIKDVILKEGQRATFQQDNLLNTAISALFNTIFGKGKETGLANLVKTVTVSPYIKIPANAYWSYYNLVNPEIALLQSFVHGGRAFYLNKSGEKNQAKLALRESRYWLAHSITGMAMKAVVIALVKAAVYNPGSDEEESKREREGKAFFEGQGTINIDKLNAVLAGEDPTQVKNGLLIPNRWFGQWGTVGNAIARKYENMTPEQRKNEADYYDFMLGELSTDVLQEMEQGIFANTSSLLSLLQTGNLNRYLTNTLNMFTNIVHPAAIAQISRAEIPNFTTQKADSFLKELENAMLTRSSFLRDLTGKYPPSKIGIWGEPIAKQGGTVQKLFNITRVNKDMFARPLYDDAKKYNDINFFPPAVTSSLNGKQLTVAQTRALQEFVGQARKARIAPYINDSAIIEGYSIKYSDLKDPEDKKKVLNYLYEMGRRDGLEKFYNQYKDLKPEEKTEDFLKELQFDLFKTLQKYK